jgi:predicted urease superfamily metal-dependent hydrolase
MTTMNTLNTIINSISQNINENVIEGLSQVGFSHKEATKLVVENSFSLADDAMENPVESF